jgi:hypothetical protein
VQRQRERETKRLLSALPNVGHQILHISGAGIIGSSPYIHISGIKVNFVLN